MTIFHTLVLLLFFPLNGLLPFEGAWVQGKTSQQQATQDVAQQIPEDKGEVRGAEDVKESTTEPEPISLFAAGSLQPLRKEGVSDLVLPSAHASIILDADSGTILHYNKGRDHRQIASLTKVMTAVLAMENIKDLDEPVLIDEEAVYAEGTRVGCPRSGYCISQRLKVGEKVAARDLLKAILMNSANDAAIALGKHMGGTQEGFAEIMNTKARQMGLTDTNFCTPSGLEIDGKETECYSSAYDIARIAAYSLRYPLLWEIARLPSNTVIYSVDGKIEHYLLNTDVLLDEMPNIIGTKTGFTPLAGHSLLMLSYDQARKHRIVSVLLDDPYRWQDIRAMQDWAFSSHVWK